MGTSPVLICVGDLQYVKLATDESICMGNEK